MLWILCAPPHGGNHGKAASARSGGLHGTKPRSGGYLERFGTRSSEINGHDYRVIDKKDDNHIIKKSVLPDWNCLSIY